MVEDKTFQGPGKSRSTWELSPPGLKALQHTRQPVIQWQSLKNILSHRCLFSPFICLAISAVIRFTIRIKCMFVLLVVASHSSRQPEVIYDSEESSDEEVFPHPEHFRPRHDSAPVPRYVPMPGPIGSNPMPRSHGCQYTNCHDGNPNVTGNPMAAMQGNPMGMAGRRQGSMSMAPDHVQVNPQQGQVVPMDIPTRPYSYLTFYRRGARYPSMVNDLEILANVLNPKNNNLKQFVDILARRSPYELDALRHEFNVMTGGQDLQLMFNSLVTKEDDCIKSVISGLTLGPIAFDFWLLDGVLLPTLSMTDD